MAIIWSVNDAYQVDLYGTYLSQTCINKFVVHPTTVVSAAETAEVFLGEFFSQVVNVCKGLVNQGYQFKKARVLNLSTDDQGTFEYLQTVTGTNGTADVGMYLPPFLATAWRMYTDQGVSHSGWKRFAGLHENDISSGVLSPAGGGVLAATIPTFQTLLATGFITAGGNSFEFGVWGKHDTLPGFTTYPIIQVGYPKLGSQNSRKIAVGI